MTRRYRRRPRRRRHPRRTQLMSAPRLFRFSRHLHDFKHNFDHTLQGRTLLYEFGNMPWQNFVGGENRTSSRGYRSLTVKGFVKPTYPTIRLAEGVTEANADRIVETGLVEPAVGITMRCGVVLVTGGHGPNNCPKHLYVPVGTWNDYRSHIMLHHDPDAFLGPSLIPTNSGSINADWEPNGLGTFKPKHISSDGHNMHSNLFEHIRAERFLRAQEIIDRSEVPKDDGARFIRVYTRSIHMDPTYTGAQLYKYDRGDGTFDVYMSQTYFDIPFNFHVPIHFTQFDDSNTHVPSVRGGRYFLYFEMQAHPGGYDSVNHVPFASGLPSSDLAYTRFCTNVDLTIATDWRELRVN